MRTEAVNYPSDYHLPIDASSLLPMADPATINVLFERQVYRTPNRVAISFGEERWTYAELDRQANAIAAALVPRLSRPEPLIGVTIRREPAMVAALLGILKAGAAYLPLDPDLPPARIAQIVEDAAPEWVIGRREQLIGNRLAWGQAKLVALEDAVPAADGFAAEPGDPGDLAYVIYTSGSTGKPKGVEVRHAGVASLIRAAWDLPGFGCDDVLLAVTRMSFDVSVLDFFLPLSCGSQIVLADEATACDPVRLAALIESSGATLLQATPTTWQALVDSGWQGSRRLRAWTGGEALPSALAQRLLPRVGELWNVYGPTETTIWSAAHRVTDADVVDVPIGRPVGENSVVVVDERLRPVTPGQVGELCIGGPGLARGYRGREAMTAERFVTLSGSGERVYRTGDRVRLDPEGRLHCLGRNDDQVKIRGHRVEMGELEAVLMRHPAVAAAAVRTWPDPIGAAALFAYVVPRDPQDELHGLVAHLRALLPVYMLPHRIFRIETLPLTSSRKVDRKALLPPDAMPDAAIVRARSDEPLDATETALAAIWQDLLRVETVGRKDDFFDLGGYSLLTVQLLLRIEETFDRVLTMTDLFSASALDRMALLVASEPGAFAASPLVPLRPTGEGEPLYWLDGGPLLRVVTQAMPHGRPVLGLNLCSDDERSLAEAGFTVATLAAMLRERLKAVAPAGPYRLGGWCRWGIVAYELACQLRDGGDEVRLLMLLDADRPRPGLPWWRNRRRMRFFIPHHADAALQAHAPGSFGQSVEEATHRYRPRRYDGNVALLRPAELSSRASLDGGWHDIVDGEFTVYRTPGSHLSMIRAPHAERLAAAMGAALATA